MKAFLRTLLAVAAMTAFSSAAAMAAQEADRTKIESVLRAYEAALNAADTDAVMALYAPDGVFMPQHSPSQVGADAVRAAYERVFAAIALDIAFEIAEIRLLAPGWAFARTNSAGFVTPRAPGGTTGNATGKPVAEANQELFILQKRDGGAWKIARYIFSTTNPRRR